MAVFTAADFTTRYYLNGTEIEPPAQAVRDLEDGYEADWDAFVSQDDLTAENRCTADNTLVTGDGQRRACRNGHCWLYVAPEPAVRGSGWGWRQAS